uniref:Putative trypsin-like serine protease n=1 Tax=Anopheles braziliensis TaxID=58242 RepID=A0A2M3Z3F2_9DIPT
MKQSVKFVLLAVLFCAYCATAHGNKRVVRMANGIAVPIADYPYVVTVNVTDSSGQSYYKPGVIITDTQVLTAATVVSRTVYQPAIVSIVIRAGSVYQDQGGFTFPVSNYQKDPLHNSPYGSHDVAVITINGSFSGYANVKPIAMHSTPLPPATNCVALGWDTDVSSNALLRQAAYALSTDADCAASLDGPVPPTVQCAASVTVGFACHDDGGPLVCNGRLYGLLQQWCYSGVVPFVSIPAAETQSYLSPLLVFPASGSATVPRKNYMTCSCQSC